jgi:hypothetical protein
MRTMVAHGTDSGTAAVGEEQDRVDVALMAAEGQDAAQQALGDDVRGARLVFLQGETSPTAASSWNWCSGRSG